MPRIDFTSHRLFLASDLAEGGQVPLDKGQANYLLNVLRLVAGTKMLVFNGRDGEWQAGLAIEGKRAARLEIGQQTRPQPPASAITYAFAPLKHARLDYMVQKAVEMGAACLQPVMTRRTVAERINLERMRANVIEAAEQCGVLAVPEVAEPLTLEHLLANRLPEAPLIFCDEDAETANPVTALAQLPRGTPALVLIGPEGGFDPAERDRLLRQPNVVRLSLGPRILRADTAGVAALALVQSVIGDWN